DEAVAILKALPSIRTVDMINGAIEAQYEGDDATAASILQALTAAGISVSGFSQLDGGLEDAFLKATSEDVGRIESPWRSGTQSSPRSTAPGCAPGARRWR